MKRMTALPLLLAVSCTQQPTAETLKAGTYFGAGRDALCIVGDDAPQKFAFIAFAPEGDTNCAAEGRVERSGEAWFLVPNGEGACRLPAASDGQTMTLGSLPATCAYYCGPGAKLSGQRFHWTDTQDLLLAANPLAHGGVC